MAGLLQSLLLSPLSTIGVVLCRLTRTLLTHACAASLSALAYGIRPWDVDQFRLDHYLDSKKNCTTIGWLNFDEASVLTRFDYAFSVHHTLKLFFCLKIFSNFQMF